MTRLRTRLTAVLAVAMMGTATMVATAGSAHALSNPAVPALAFDHTITSHPFAGAPGNAIDIEGLGYVPSDSSMWVADDNGDRVWEINPSTGAYKSQLRGGKNGTDFLNATQVGTGLTCAQALDGGIVGDTGANECLSRTDDFESVVYDPTGDVLYVTSGNCCTAGLPAGYPYHPTVWELERVAGHFTPTHWQALPDGQDPTAGGWRPGTGIYFGKSNKIHTYDFATNTLGSDKTLALTDIVGITFTDASTAFVTTATPNTASGRTTATSDSTIHRFDISGSTWTETPGWTFPLKNIGVPGGSVDDDGMIDARDLAIVGDSFYVTDGYDSRASADHPIYVYTLGNAAASFVAAPNTGNRPLNVQFFDTSTGHPTAWAWDFDNNGSTDSTLQFPAHVYNVAGTYTVKLTATYPGGTLSTTQTVTVKVPTGAPGGWIVDGYGGLQAIKVGNGALPPAVSNNAYWPGWDIARGAGVLPDNSGGYVLDGWGGVHSFRIGNGATPPGVTKNAYWSGWDIARGMAILPNGKGGYMVDGYGGIHTFALGSNSSPAAAVGGPYWQGQDMARGIMLTRDGKGGYVVDRTGKLYPFKVGNSGTMPPTANNVAIVSAVSMQGGAVIADGTGGFTVDGFGGTHGFGIGAIGPPPAVTQGPYWPGWDIARDIALLSS
ncbi:MAG: PKD domain-containing protein [Acidimicrobiia bacterium]